MKKSKLFVLPFTAIVFSLGFQLQVSAVETASGKPPPTQASGPAKQVPPPPSDSVNPITVNAITGMAARAGVTKCLTRVNQVTNFVTANSESGAYLFISPNQPDDSFISSSLEVQQKKILTYASASFAPVGSGSCGGVYETVTYWPENCEIVGSKGFAKLKNVGVVQKHIQILQGDGNMRMFLVPAGAGCISIKKEVIY